MSSRNRDAARHVYLFGGHTQHSFAPTLWNYTFERLGVDADYIAENVEDADLPDAVTRILDPDVMGANVTIPLKEAAAGLAHRTDPDVAATGATNWLYAKGTVLHAANTDVVAARQLTEGSWRQAIILGAGGGGAAVAAGLSAYTNRILVADIDGARALALRDRIRSWGTLADAVDWDGRRESVASSDVLVNATPLGMAGALSEATPVEVAWLSDSIRVYDLVYAPHETPLARAARMLGLPLIDGLAHLYEQAVALLPLMGVNDPKGAVVLAEGVNEAFAGRTGTDWASRS